MRTKRAREKIVAMLRDMGPLTTTKIYNELNKWPVGKYALRHGSQMAQINNVLGKSPEFVKLTCSKNDPADQRAKVQGIASTYAACVWDLDVEA